MYSQKGSVSNFKICIISFVFIEFHILCDKGEYWLQIDDEW